MSKAIATLPNPFLKIEFCVTTADEAGTAARIMAGVSATLAADVKRDPKTAALLAEVRPLLRDAGVVWGRDYLETHLVPVKVRAFGDCNATQLRALRKALKARLGKADLA